MFLAATGSIIYFKQPTEANESKRHYEILWKIGVSKKEISRSIKKQILFVFGLPLLVGIVHSGVMLHFLINFISNLIGMSLTVPIMAATTAFFAVYAAFYVLTVRMYTTIVNG